MLRPLQLLRLQVLRLRQLWVVFKLSAGNAANPGGACNLAHSRGAHTGYAKRPGAGAQEYRCFCGRQ